MNSQNLLNKSSPPAVTHAEKLWVTFYETQGGKNKKNK